jgi:hypothetical protein
MAGFRFLIVKNKTFIKYPFFIIMLCDSKCFASTLRFVSLIVGPFFLAENTITGFIYLHMLEAFCFPQFAEIKHPNVMFLHQGASPHFCKFMWNN